MSSQLLVLILLLLTVAICQGLIPTLPTQPRHVIPPQAQQVTVIDASTGVTCVLLGTMHYNPSSIAKSRDLVSSLARENRLAAVLIESCEARWNRTLINQAEGSFLRSLLDNEMQSASEAATEYQVPTLLADQNITLTTTRMKETLKESLADLASLRLGKLWSELDRARKIVLTPALPVMGVADRDEQRSGAAPVMGVADRDEQRSGAAPRLLNSADFLEPSLLLGSPVSLVRYPLAILIKSPIVGSVIMAAVAYALATADEGFTGAGAGAGALESSAALGLLGSSGEVAQRVLDVVQTALTILIEAAVVGRTFLVCLLEERNKVLTDNIRSACRKAAEDAAAAAANGGEGGEKKTTVVAILGAAHVNGIVALLLAE